MFIFTRDCDDQISLLRNRSILPLSNRIIVQQEFRLTFTGNQELIRRSNFCADIYRAHIVCPRQEEDLAILSVSHSIAYLNSFRYGFPCCSVSTLTVLHHAIRHRSRSTIRMISFFYILRQIHSWYSTIQFLQDQQNVCIRCS